MATPADGILVPQVQLNNSNILAQAVDTFISTNRLPNANEARAQIFQPVVGGILNQLPGFQGSASLVGTWESVHYADDLIAHAPKPKFLFKVAFVGFAPKNFYYFVQQVDKPKIRLNHTEVNYYNFRSKVLTSVAFEPLSMTFLDEIGNSVTEFYRYYMEQHSGQHRGNYGTNYGFGISSSSRPYSRGYSSIQQIILEQIFANGVNTNRYIFVNPRIETFDFDQLDMTDNGGSQMTINFHYDAIKVETLNYATYYSWGNNDIHRGGSIAGINAGATSTTENGPLQVMSVSGGGGIGSYDGSGYVSKQQDLSAIDLRDAVGQAVPSSLTGLVGGSSIQTPTASLKGVIGSSLSGVDQQISNTINNAASTLNMRFSGGAPGSTSAQVAQAFPVEPPPNLTGTPI